MIRRRTSAPLIVVILTFSLFAPTVSLSAQTDIQMVFAKLGAQ